jgi:hypothetical protein
MIPLARKLQEQGHIIFIGSGRSLMPLFRGELNGLNHIYFPGFKPWYSGILPQYLALLLQLPRLFFWILREHQMLKKIIPENKIDIVISDNRFGLWNRNIRSVYVTHQPLIPFPRALRFMEWTGILWHRQIIKKYSLCLIPDLPGKLNLTGRLTHGLKLPANVRFAGILSRFTNENNAAEKDNFISPRNTLILSGPEPQKSIFRDKIVPVLKERGKSTVVLEGRPEAGAESTREGTSVSFSHLPTRQMKLLIEGSDLVISRSGYSSIMEFVSMNKSALLIPTPGQCEQEYIARFLSDKGWFCMSRQKEIKPGMELNCGILPVNSDILKVSGILLEKAVYEILHDPDKEDHQ